VSATAALPVLVLVAIVAIALWVDSDAQTRVGNPGPAFRSSRAWN